MSVIPATQEAEVGGLQVVASPAKYRDLTQKQNTVKGVEAQMVEHWPCMNEVLSSVKQELHKIKS
jgi:hypothetical protein